MARFPTSRLSLAVIICVLFILITIIASFILKSPNDSTVATLSLSFTVIGAVATVATLIIAFMLYDKFGLKNKFIEKQTDKVLELVDFLKGKEITCESNNLTYIIRPSKIQLMKIGGIHSYKDDAKKIIVISIEDYHVGVDKLHTLSRSYWMPESIKEKINFLEIPGYFRFEDSIKDYIKLEFEKNSNIDLGIPLGNPTLEDFINNLLKLVIEIESWLNIHSGIKINFKMEEPH